MNFTAWLRSLRQSFQSKSIRPRQRRPRPVKLALEELESRLTPSTSFLGVAAGDATSSDVILWTRAQDPSTAAGVALIAQVSTDQTFASGIAFTGTTDPAQDYTV